PLSYAQQRLWFLDRLEGGSGHYNMPAALRLSGVLEVDALRRALDRIVERHEVLRTRFVEVEGAVHQVARPALRVPVELIDLTAQPSEAQQREVQARARADAQRAFDLQHDLLLRVQLLRLSDDQHVVLFNMHHIASDGWSQGVLIRELSALYAAFVAGGEDPLPALPVQYADYAAWQRQWLQGEVLERELGYWRERLAGAPSVHSLPLDHARPVQQRFVGGLLERRLPAALSTQLQDYARAQGATLFMALQTAFAVLLARYSDESDIVMGTSTAGRTHQDVEGLIGFFINTLVLRTELDDNPGFARALARSRQRILEAYGHAQVPFEMLVETLRPERSLSHNPLVQVLFSLNNVEAGELQLAGLSLTPLGVDEVGSQYDLELNARESAAGIALGWQYNVDLFEPATIERLAEAFEQLLTQVLAHPDVGVWELDLGSARERQAQAEWNAATAAYAAEGALHHAVEQQAQRTPEAIAVHSAEGVLSYRSLNERANRVAHLLRSQGVGDGHLIGLCAERSLQQLIGLLAILKSGAAYVPLDPQQPQARLQEIIDESGIERVLCQSQWQDELTLETMLIPLDGGLAERLYASQPASDPEMARGGDALAYVLYTSGSSGRPKGVEVSHAAVLDYCAGARARYYAESLSGAYLMTSLAFDLTVPSVYLPWQSGGRIVLAAAGDEMGAGWAGLSDEAQPCLVRLTPSHIRLLTLPARWTSTVPHVFVIGGEALAGADLARLRAHFPQARLFNHYGPTEAIVGCSAYDASDDQFSTAVPIGRPLPNARLYVVGRHGARAPQGAPGELYVGRRALATGYRGQAELTAEKFVVDGYGNDGRLYRTGDRVRQRSDGELDYLGRIDQQVKLRGYRIELGEIEARLAEQPDVQACAVNVRQDGAAGDWLVAY
ncbi:amino acid adenylation domain-containing protein, partial [Aquimonas sp.]|uniref:non-ribosomal peptide synthetase n=1 Tax=Aquimonas sp. TaxID=1872588 RepID=UPI0037C0FF7D